MTKEKKLTKRQQAVIDDLFTGEMDQQGVLEKHHVSPALYSRWLADEHFAEQLERRLAQTHQSGRILLARHAYVAAGKLINLTQCKKEEVARRACLDIITLHSPSASGLAHAAPAANEAAPAETELAPETASRLLAALAQPTPPKRLTPEQQPPEHR